MSDKQEKEEEGVLHLNPLHESYEKALAMQQWVQDMVHAKTCVLKPFKGVYILCDVYVFNKEFMILKPKPFEEWESILYKHDLIEVLPDDMFIKISMMTSSQDDAYKIPSMIHPIFYTAHTHKLARADRLGMESTQVLLGVENKARKCVERHRIIRNKCCFRGAFCQDMRIGHLANFFHITQ